MKNLLYFDKHRKATWLELFFDLIFVVVIGRITHILAHTHHGHLKLEYILKFFLVFVPIWWLWATHTAYSNLYDTDSKSHRLVTLIIMLLMIGLSVFVDVDFDKVYLGFISFYSAIRLILALLYIQSKNLHENNKKHATMLGTVHIINTLFGLASIFFPSPLRYYVFYLALFVDMFLPIFIGRKMEHVKVHSEHLVERTGLLIIILLGESVISLANTLPDLSWNWFNLSAALSGFILIGGIWWILFDFIYLLIESDKIKKPYIIMIPSLFLYIGLAVIASVIRHAILSGLDLTTFRFLAFGGVLIFFLGKQVPYYIIFVKIRKYILTNTLMIFILTGLSLLLPRAEYILIGITLTLFAYIFSTFRYMIDEEIAERHLKKMGKNPAILLLKNKKK